MPVDTYDIWECSAQECSFRFPVGAGEKRANWKGDCPRCHTPANNVASYPLYDEQKCTIVEQNQPILHFAAMLDNLRSTWNVGSMFRSADGAGFSHLFLCGITPTPLHPKVANTALGAEQYVTWSYYPNALRKAVQLKAQGWHLLALESGVRENDLPLISIFDSSLYTLAASYLLIVGNEKYGIDPELISLCEKVLYIPMQGQKRSLNVAVAFGIAAYGIIK